MGAERRTPVRNRSLYRTPSAARTDLLSARPSPVSSESRLRWAAGPSASGGSSVLNGGIPAAASTTPETPTALAEKEPPAADEPLPEIGRTLPPGAIVGRK